MRKQVVLHSLEYKSASFFGLFLGLKKKRPASGYTSLKAVESRMAQLTT